MTAETLGPVHITWSLDGRVAIVRYDGRITRTIAEEEPDEARRLAMLEVDRLCELATGLLVAAERQHAVASVLLGGLPQPPLSCVSYWIADKPGGGEETIPVWHGLTGEELTSARETAGAPTWHGFDSLAEWQAHFQTDVTPRSKS